MTRAPNIERVVYDEWRGNFRSNLRVLGKNTKEYTSMNMQVYQDGKLGVRPWWRLRDDTGLTGSLTLLNNSFLQWRPVSGNSKGELWVRGFSGTNEVWYYDFDADSWTNSSTVSALVSASDNRAEYWGTRHDWDSSGQLVGSAINAVLPEDTWIFQGEMYLQEDDTATAISWVDASNSIVNFTMYRDRIWGWSLANVNATTPTNRLFYTDAGSYTSTTAGNYIDIGPASEGYYIVGCWPIRDSLLIAMSSGEWYVFTGTPASGSLRFIGKYPVPAHGGAGAILNNAVYFLSPYGRQVCIATPSGVDSVTLQDYRAFSGNDIRWNIFHDYRGLASQQEQALLLATLRNNQDQWFDALEFVNGSWVYSGFGRDRFSDTSSNIGYLRDLCVVGQEKAYAFLMEDPDAPGSDEAQLYTRDIVLNRPSRSTDEWSDSKEVAAGDTATGLPRGGVRLAPFGPPGEEVRVRQVIVDFHYWKDDSTTYEDPDLRCVTLDGGRLGLESVDSFSASALPSFEDESLPADTQLGLPYRWIFRFDMESAEFRNSIQVQIDDMISVAIDRIIVDYEIRPDNHWAGQMGGT